MSTHKQIDRICCIAIALAVVLTVVFMNGEALGLQAASAALGYEDRLFDADTVHTIAIEMEDWEGFLDSCMDEEYALCSLVIDGETYSNVAIRAKGNTSLTQVASYGNDRYSFKIAFDHYDSAISYHGLDKLSLNNIIQDNTYMKDYLTYQMMGFFGVDAPLCSYAYITVNGEDWGLYLAVEGVEESFLRRNYGNDYGELYKPDSMSMGGGRGNGGQFNMENWQAQDGGAQPQGEAGESPAKGMEAMPWQMGLDTVKSLLQSMDDAALQTLAEALGYTDAEALLAACDTAESVEDLLNGRDFTEVAALFAGSNGFASEDDGSRAREMQRPEDGGFAGFSAGGMMPGSMGSDDVSLVYTDDAYSSYENIFDNAKTDITDADKDRLIASLRQLNDCENIEDVVDVEEVIRYFVVHNFVCNFDSYTGSMIHNYYLYEEDGQLSMIPWDYNLAFGGFQGAQDATALVNYPIDTPVSGGTVDSRPMLAWIFSDPTYTEMYHQAFAEFIDGYFGSGYFAEMMEQVQAMISPYVEKDPTKFCTYEEFETGIATLKAFCLLRAESIEGQLAGTIPSTSDGQSQDSSTLVDAGEIQISDMGSMNSSMGGGMRRTGSQDEAASEGIAQEQRAGQTLAVEETPPAADEGGEDEAVPEDGSGQGIPEIPQGGAMPWPGGDEGMGVPEGFTAPEDGGEMPEMEWPGSDSGQERPETGGSGGMGDTAAGGASTGILLGASVLVLAVGIAFAAAYKGHRG